MEGHIDITNRARAGTLAQRAIPATSQVAMVGALPFGFFAVGRVCEDQNFYLQVCMVLRGLTFPLKI